MTLNVTQGHRNCLLFDRPYISLLVVSNDSIWHCFQDIITFKLTLYVTGCDLEKSFVFEKIVEITSLVRFPIHE